MVPNSRLEPDQTNSQTVTEHSENCPATTSIDANTLISDADTITFDGLPVGYVDSHGNIRLKSHRLHEDRVIGHIANDRDYAISVLRNRYIQYLQQTQEWCDETRVAENRLWRISDCDRRMSEIDQQYVLGDLDAVRTILEALKAELAEEQQNRIKQRKELIAKAHELKNRTDWKEVGKAFDELNDAFKAVGTAGDRDMDQEQWDHFKKHEREFRTRRKAHFDQLEQEFAERTKAKESICESAESLQESSDFKAAGQQLRNLMDQWKQIGFAGREHDEPLWQRFQAARAIFNERRKQWFDENAVRKEELAIKAEALASLEDAAAAQQQMKPLMQQWRKVGSAGRNADEALWARFRAAQEDVYQRSRAIFDARHQERQRNYEAKETLVTEAESLIGQDSRVATKRCKDLQQQWKQIGPVPHDLNEQQWHRFRAACDSIFRIANAEGKRRIEDARDRAEEQIRKLSAEIDEHERKIAHWEGVLANLRDGANAEEIRESMNEKIATAKERIEIKLGWIEEHHKRMTELGAKL